MAKSFTFDKKGVEILQETVGMVQRLTNGQPGFRRRRHSSQAQPSGSGTKQIKITSGTGKTHVGDVYGNGYHKAATETGVPIKVNHINAGSSIPALWQFSATQQPWDADGAVDAGTYWTIDFGGIWF